MSKAHIRITPQVLEGALKMPEGMTIVYMQYNIFNGTLGVLVEHPNIPATEPGEQQPKIVPTYTQGTEGITVDWGEWLQEEKNNDR